MEAIAPCIWFDTQASEAADFYTAIFKNSKVNQVGTYPDDSRMPKGTVINVQFDLCGQPFVALNGGPLFKVTPAISFYIDCETNEELDLFWSKLGEGGSILMPLDAYPFSEKFGWVQDKFGVSWQVNLSKTPQRIRPFLMFTGDHHGKAETAMNYYRELFPDSSVNSCLQYGKGETEPEGTVKLAEFTLNNQPFMAIDSAAGHQFTFNEAVSFQVHCDDQAEIDRLWDLLSANGEKSMCGWLKDQFGVSWIISSSTVNHLLTTGTPAQIERMMKEIMKMKKIDIATLERASAGE